MVLDACIRIILHTEKEKRFEQQHAGNELAVALVTRALNTKLHITNLDAHILLHPNNANMERAIQHLQSQCHTALTLQCRERVYLANYVARYGHMSEHFSNAYVAFMVQSGEGLGHEDLAELVQDEELFVSSMLAYDVILSGVGGAWEDPGRPPFGFWNRYLGNRAHARAQLQRSLFKFQERHGMKGGTPSAGIYGDAPSAATAMLSPVLRGVKRYNSGSSSSSVHVSKDPASSSSNVKMDSAAAASSSSSFPPLSSSGVSSGSMSCVGMYFHPAHNCAPLEMDNPMVSMGDTPYGNHNTNVYVDAYNGGGGGGNKRARYDMDVDVHSQKAAAAGGGGNVDKAKVGDHAKKNKNDDNGDATNKNNVRLFRSTKPIDWARGVASQFQPVTAPAGSNQHHVTPTHGHGSSVAAAIASPAAANSGGAEASSSTPGGGGSSTAADHPARTSTSAPTVIFAPSVRKLTKEQLEKVLQDVEGDASVEEEEDISDAAILARHQAVLNEMKSRIDHLMEARKNRYRSPSNAGHSDRSIRAS